MPAPLLGLLGRAALAGGEGVTAQALGQAAGQKAAGALTALVNPLASVTQGVNKLHQSLSLLEAPFKAIEGIFQHIGQYVSKFNPASVTFFERAVADFEASIGQILVPILNAGTQVFRKFGDTVAYFGPILEKMAQKYADGIVKGFTALIDFYVVLVDFLEVTQALNAALTILNAVATVFLTIIKALTFAMSGGKGAPKTEGLSQGKAYQPAQTTTVQAMITRLQESAYGLGVQMQQLDVQQRQLEELRAINQNTSILGRAQNKADSLFVPSNQNVFDEARKRLAEERGDDPLATLHERIPDRR